MATIGARPSLLDALATSPHPRKAVPPTRGEAIASCPEAAIRGAHNNSPVGWWEVYGITGVAAVAPIRSPRNLEIASRPKEGLCRRIGLVERVGAALSSMDAPCIASGSDELGRNVGLAVIYPALWRGR